MLKIDAHQHFWKFDSVNHSWITEDMAVIRRDFMPQDLEPVLKRNGMDGCVLVQVDQTPEENLFQLKNAREHDFIKGVVGWVDLRSVDIEEQLQELRGHDLLKGFRHILQGEDDRALMLRPEFLNGVGKLRHYGFTYDILIFPDQLVYAAEFAGRFPDLPMVLDHIAKPDIRGGEAGDWEQGLRELAKRENVYCKVSGMVTEARWRHWKHEDFVPYLDVVFDAFGTDRVMFGSDWPVCLVSAGYEALKEITDEYISGFSGYERELFMGGNAVKFYNLK